MPATAQIVLEMDESGAVQGVDKLGAKLDALGSRGAIASAQINQGFTNMGAGIKGLDPALDNLQSKGVSAFSRTAEQIEHSREGAALFANMLGIQLPRSIDQLIAKSQTLGPIFDSAFEGAAVGTAVAQIIIAGGQLVQKFIDMRQAAAVAFAAIQKSAADAEVSMLEQSLAKAQSLRVEAADTTANAVQKVENDFHAARVQLLEQWLDADASAKITGDTQAAEAANDALNALDEKHLADKHAVLLQEQAAVRQSMDDAVISTVLGLAKINAENQKSLDNIRDQQRLGALTYSEAEAARAALHASTNDKIRLFDIQLSDFQHGIAVSGAQAQEQIAESGLTGKSLIYQQELAQLSAVTQKENQLQEQSDRAGLNIEVNLENERVAVHTSTTQKITELDRQRLEELQQMETDTAIALLSPWQRADASIVASANDRIQKIEDLIRKDATFQQQGAEEIALIQEQTFAKMRDNLADDLDSLFSDIASGNLGQRILKNFEKLCAQLVAQWLITTNVMGGAFGNIFGSLLGINIPGAGAGGSAVGALGTLFGLGATRSGSSGISGAGAGTSFLGGNVNFLSGGTSAVGSSGGSFAGSAATGGILGSLFPHLFGGSGAGSVAPTASFGDLAAGGLISGIPQSGGIGGAIGLGGTPAGSGAAIGGGFSLSGLLGAAGPLGLLLGPSLLGSSNGLVRTLGGAATGLGIGSLLAASSLAIGPALGFGALGMSLLGFAGPIGAAIGGVAALLSWIFGNSGKDKKAQSQVIDPLTKTISDALNQYNLHQSDAASVDSSLETDRTNAKQSLSQIGSGQLKKFGPQVDSAIDAAEQQIASTETERARRAAIDFGPAQFERGGYIGWNLGGDSGYWDRRGVAAMHFSSGGGVPAIVHPGEFVLKNSATQSIGIPALNQMNQTGQLPGAQQIHVHFHTTGAVDEKWLRNGGAVTIGREVQRAVRRGHRF